MSSITKRSSTSPLTVGRPSPSKYDMFSNRPQRPQSPVSKVFARNAQVLADPGEIWLSHKKGEDPWPVVICDEEMLSILSKGRKRPDNARKANGQWRKEYLPGGKLEGQVVFPTMKLRTLTFRWTPWSRLLPVDVQGAGGVRDLIEDRDLKEAYSEAIEQYGNSDLTYWKDRLYPNFFQDDSTSEKVRVKKETEISPLKRRVSEMGLMYPPVINIPDELDGSVKAEEDDKLTSLFLEDTHKTDSDQTDESLKRLKTNRGLAVTPARSNSTFTSLSPLSTSDPMVTPLACADVAATKMSDNFVTVYIGSPHKTFLVKRSGLRQCSILETNISQDSAIGPYVMSPLLLSIDPEDFGTVVKFMNYGRFLCKDPLQVARTYILSNKLGIESLGSESWQAFSHYLSTPTGGVLSGIKELVTANLTGKPLYPTLVRHMADKFWIYLRLDLDTLQSILRVDKDVTKAIFDELALLKWF